MCKTQDAQIYAKNLAKNRAKAEREGTPLAETAKPSGSFGRQFVLGAIAQAVISPLIGKLMDLVSKKTGKVNYIVPFAGNAIFLLLTVVMVCTIKLDLDLPKTKGIKSLGLLFINADIVVFLFMTFALGTCWGFIETFLFVLLKDDMGAPMWLLGLTITTGALASIPFLFIADWLVSKIGRVNVFIIAFAMYSVRYFGYSYITNPWMAFPFEALELFTHNLMRIATVQYVGAMAPKGNI